MKYIFNSVAEAAAHYFYLLARAHAHLTRRVLLLVVGRDGDFLHIWQARLILAEFVIAKKAKAAQKRAAFAYINLCAYL
jgi:hypothetical protein